MTGKRAATTSSTAAIAAAMAATGIYLAVVLAGCASIAVKTERTPGTDISTLGGFAWSDTKKFDSGNTLVDSSDLDGTMRGEVERILHEKGYRKTDRDSADFVIRYHVGVEHLTDESNLNELQTDRAGWFGPQGDEGYVVSPGATGQYTHEYDRGSLVLDFLDADTQRMIYRVSAETELHLLENDGEMRAKRMRNAVDKMLKKFPAHG